MEVGYNASRSRSLSTESKKSGADDASKERNGASTDVIDVDGWGKIGSSCALSFTYSHALLYCKDRFELLALEGNPFQEKIGPKSSSNLKDISAVFKMEDDSETTLVARASDEGQTVVYEFAYKEGSSGTNVEQTPLFEWDDDDVKFIALKKEETWGMVVSSRDVTFFQYDSS